MVPRGNMVHCLLREEEGSKLVQAKCNIGDNTVPDDIIEIETEMVEFLESGITGIEREGSSLTVRAGEREIAFTQDRA